MSCLHRVNVSVVYVVYIDASFVDIALQCSRFRVARLISVDLS